MDKNTQNNENKTAGVNPYKGSGTAQPSGFVIGNLDPSLRGLLGVPDECPSIGIVTSQKKSLDMYSGADEAIK